MVWRRLFGAFAPRGARSPELQRIIQQLAAEPEPGENRERLRLVRRALDLHARQDDPKLWGVFQRELALRLLDRLDGDREENVEEAIAALSAALEVRPRDRMPAEWARARSNLAHAYMDRIRGVRGDNVERCIEGLSEVLEVRTRDLAPMEFAGTQMDLASAYVERQDGSRAENLERALAGFDTALSVWTPAREPFDWATAQHNRANTLCVRLEGDRRENIEQAIAGYRQALACQPRGEPSPNWLALLVSSQLGLADAYRARLEGPRAENLEAALRCCHELLPQIDPERYTLLWADAMLTTAELHDERVAGDPAENIEQAIAGFRHVLNRLPSDAAPDVWVRAMTGLAAAYTRRIAGTPAENVAAAAQASEAALAVVRAGRVPGQWRKAMLRCGHTFMHHSAGERATAIERALACYEAALDGLAPANEPRDWSGLHMSLANALMERVRGRPEDNRRAAIAHYRDALTQLDRQRTPHDWAQVHSNLATAYLEPTGGDRPAALALAIASCEAALQVYTRHTTPDQWAAAQLHLASALTDEHQPEREPTSERALAILHDVLTVWTRTARPVRWAQTQENLANALATRPGGNCTDNLEAAAVALRAALEVLTVDFMPEAHLKVLWRLGTTLFDLARWDEAIARLRQAFDVREALYRSAETQEDRARLLSRHPGIDARLAFALAQLGGTAHLEEAALVVERGRARIVSEQLALDVAPLAHVTPADREAYDTVKRRLRQLTARAREELTREAFLDVAAQSRAARAERNAVIARIMAYVPAFFAEPEWRDIQAAARQAPLAYLVVTDAGGCAIVIDRAGQAASITLPQLTQENVLLAVQQLVLAEHAPHAVHLAGLDHTLRWIWTALMAPLLDALAPEREVVVIATNLLGLLPLHAAWTPDDGAAGGRRAALDAMTVRYTPNARALRTAQAAAPIVSARPSVLLAVDEPRPVTAGGLKDATLEGAALEVRHVAARFADPRTVVVRHEAATRQALLRQMPAAEVLHFACHGAAVFDAPLRSGLYMAHDEILSLRDMLDMRLQRTRVAVLSACQTAVVGGDLPDEVLGLPAGLLVAGAAGIVGSLWRVPDAGTTVLMMQFYDRWMCDGLPPGEALAAAQRWMRRATREELHAYLVAQTDASTAERLLRDEEDLQHPYHWAAFCYTGV